jgi:hypothetical protein
MFYILNEMKTAVATKCEETFVNCCIAMPEVGRFVFLFTDRC